MEGKTFRKKHISRIHDFGSGKDRKHFFSRVARFFLVERTKKGKIYQITIKYTKWPQNIPNVHNIDQHIPLQDAPKFSQIGIFDLKICHMTTLFSVLRGKKTPPIKLKFSSNAARTEDRGFESRQGVMFKGLQTLQCCSL
jgi:hypothetical protein